MHYEICLTDLFFFVFIFKGKGPFILSRQKFVHIEVSCNETCMIISTNLFANCAAMSKANSCSAYESRNENPATRIIQSASIIKGQHYVDRGLRY